MPYYVVCEAGHISDFPYDRWCHKGAECPGVSNLIYRNNVPTPYILCTTCEASNYIPTSFKGDAYKDFFNQVSYNCYGDQPWKSGTSKCNCTEQIRIIRKEDSNSYFPINYSSVKLPRKKSQKDISWQNDPDMPGIISKYEKNKDLKYQSDRFKSRIKELIDDYEDKGITLTEYEIVSYINKDEVMHIDDFKRDEYNVLDQITKMSDYELNSLEFKQMVFDLSDIPDDYKNDSYYKIFNTISVLERLTVVTAAVGFSRVKPRTLSKEDEKYVNSLKRADGKYIATELKGEGIFFSFKKEWIKKNIENKDEKKRFIHTISHLMMKELGEVSGYPITSLSERLYFDDTKGKEMYGVLIYTASNDKNGTLGGVVEEGTLKNFLKNFRNSIDKAKWCSYDPICSQKEIDNEKHNIAACHYCTFAPETSCEEFNGFLDRGIVLETLKKIN